MMRNWHECPHCFSSGPDSEAGSHCKGSSGAVCKIPAIVRCVARIQDLCRLRTSPNKAQPFQSCGSYTLLTTKDEKERKKKKKQTTMKGGVFERFQPQIGRWCVIEACLELPPAF